MPYTYKSVAFTWLIIFGEMGRFLLVFMVSLISVLSIRPGIYAGFSDVVNPARPPTPEASADEREGGVAAVTRHECRAFFISSLVNEAGERGGFGHAPLA